jgi:phage-related protein
MNAFILDNNINSRTDLGLRITQPPIIPVSKRIVNSIAVDGREGSLTILRGWDNVQFNFRAALLISGGGDFHRRFREILPTIINAKTVYFSGDSEVFYNIKTARADTIEQRMVTLYEFALLFTCSPFRYIRNAPPITLTAAVVVTNPGTIYALPKITVYGTGSQTLTINGKPIILNILSGSLVLDSELKTCYFGNVAQNNNMQGDFPVFQPGDNAVNLSVGITKLEIEPRWRHI